jgi:uncharacterized protein (UPF0210 family)
VLAYTYYSTDIILTIAVVTPITMQQDLTEATEALEHYMDSKGVVNTAIKKQHAKQAAARQKKQQQRQQQQQQQLPPSAWTKRFAQAYLTPLMPAKLRGESEEQAVIDELKQQQGKLQESVSALQQQLDDSVDQLADKDK